MAVKFYPNNPIDALESIIQKDDGSPLFGEIDIYRKLNEDLGKSKLDWDVWHDLKLPDHSNISNYYNKTSSQIDFLIVSKLGVLVLEVKGGPISTKDNVFYYGKNFDQVMKQNPFKQVEGYKYTLKDIVLNNFKRCLFCEAVAFPHVNYPFESKLINPNLLWTSYRSENYDNSIERFLLNVYDYIRNKQMRYSRSYDEISSKECFAIKKILSPVIKDRNNIDCINTLEWLGIQNVEILEGLYKNPRIMFEGPPGSGKTTIAKAYIDKQYNKRGLYICWNNLLMHYTKSVLKQRRLTDLIEVTTYFKFFQNLNPSLSYEKLSSFTEDEFYTLVKDTTSRLELSGMLKPYDFVIVDEAQDLLDRGLDLFVNKFSGFNGKGLENGTSIILYDIDQSYTTSGRNVSEIADMMMSYFSHYKINEVKRSSQNPDIRILSIAVLENPKILLNVETYNTYNQIKIVRHNSLQGIKNHLVRNVLTPMRETDSSLRGQDCIVLIESLLLSKVHKGTEDLKELLIIKDVEEVSIDNVGDNANKLRYCSILKFKGLEKKNVFMIITEPTESNKYEIFVGITRAILNIEINILS